MTLAKTCEENDALCLEFSIHIQISDYRFIFYMATEIILNF